MDEQIIELLLAEGLIDAKVAEIIRDLISRGKTVEQAIVGGRYVQEKDYTRILAKAIGLDFIDIDGFELPEEALSLLPEQIRKTYGVLPIGLEGDVLTYAVANPQDVRALEAIQFFASGRGWKVRQVLVAPTLLRKILKIGGGGVGAEVEASLAEVNRRSASKTSSKEVENLQELIKGAPVARIVTSIMRNAVEQRASDIHIEPVGGESRVRYRIDGVLRTVLTLPAHVHPALIARVKVLANLKLDETRVPQDGRITEIYGEKKIDYRISTLPVVDNEKVVMRILDTSVGAPTLVQLGYRSEHVAIINEEIKKAHGLFLVTGPTGSGKSTTLFACLNMLNNEGVNISTLEDPVEYYISGVNQSQVRPQIGYTFATGLRSLLRQDPNVVMVGEIRDRETAELAIHASLTGHLIFSTLHTNDAFGIVPRLIDMGVEPFLLSATINIGVAQRLARKVCDGCKAPEEIPPKTLDMLKGEIAQIPKKYFSDSFDPEHPVFYHGVGCVRCKGIGYFGRIAIAEMFRFGATGRKLVEKGFPIDEAEEDAKRQEMISLRQDAILKALDGLTTVEEVLRLSQEAVEGEGAEKRKEKAAQRAS